MKSKITLSDDDIANIRRGLNEWIGRTIDGARDAINDSDLQSYHVMRRSAEETEKRFNEYVAAEEATKATSPTLRKTTND